MLAKFIYSSSELDERAIYFEGEILQPQLSCDVKQTRKQQFKDADDLGTNAFFVVERTEFDGFEAKNYHAVILLDANARRLGEITGEPAEFIVKYFQEIGSSWKGICSWDKFYTYFCVQCR